MWPSPVYSHEFDVILYALPMPPVASTIAFALKTVEPAALAVVGERPGDAVAVLQQPDDRPLHVDRDALVDAVVLQRADQFQAGAVADVGEPRVLVAAEVALEDACRPWCGRRPRPSFEFADAGRALPGRGAGPSASC